MEALTRARAVLAAVDLHPGLGVTEVRTRLDIGARLEDTGQRILAFYLTEMSERRLYQASGHSSTGHYAHDCLDMDKRRTRELIAVGKKLLTLPAIDNAFCAGRLSWSKLLLLTRVASPEHEDAWLELAQASTCRELRLEVKRSKRGAAPRDPSTRKRLPEVRFPLKTSVDVLTWQKIELAKKKLSAERQRDIDDAELLDVMAEMFLDMEEDGTVPGRVRVPSSMYRIVVRSENETDDDDEADGGGTMVADTEMGPLPIDGNAEDAPMARVRSECVRCDGECVHESGEGPPPKIDRATPPALRRRVIARDGGRCRCCRSRRSLMVHHIRYRSKGGATRAANLITLCIACHSLVHADLLLLEGTDARRVEFRGPEGRPLTADRMAEVAAILALAHMQPGDPEALAALPRPATTTLGSVPDVIDGSWWRRHVELINPRGDKGLVFRDGVPRALEVAREAPERKSLADAFAGIVGQDRLLHRIETTAAGSQSRGLSFPHALLGGPAGTGKTTLARGVAAHVGARLVEAAGPLVRDVHGLVCLLAGLEGGDMLFLDEIHAIPQIVLEVLYQAMAEGRISLTLHSGARARAVQLELPVFTLLAATTEEGDLPQALCSRFGLRESFGYYAAEDLARLAEAESARQSFELRAGAAMELARRARGTPREVLRLLDRVLDRVCAADSRVIDRDAVRKTLEDLGYDAEGLAPAEQRYLALLRSSGDPISLDRLARMLGDSARTLLRCVEPFLLRAGLVRVTPHGRLAVHRPRLSQAQVTQA